MRQVARSSSVTSVQKTEAWSGEGCWWRCGLVLRFLVVLHDFTQLLPWKSGAGRNASLTKCLWYGKSLCSSWSLTSCFPARPLFSSLCLFVFFFSPLFCPIWIGNEKPRCVSDQGMDAIPHEPPWWPAGPAVELGVLVLSRVQNWALVKLLAVVQGLFHLCSVPLGTAFFRHLCHLGLLRSLCSHSRCGSGYTCWKGCNQMNGCLIATIHYKSFCQERGNSEEKCEHYDNVIY